MILPVNHALQRHPESGKMWMKMIDNILINQLGFKKSLMIVASISEKGTVKSNCYYNRLTTFAPE